MNPLLLHCGSSYISRPELALAPLPAARGPRHVVRPFADDVEMILAYFQTQGIQVEAEAYGVKRDGEGFPVQFFGVIQIRLAGFNDARGYGLMVGLRGSHNQTLARGLAVGSRVFCCDNLAFSGEITLTTKQTTRLNQRLPAMLRDAVAQIPTLAEHQHRRFEAYRNETLTKAEGDHLLVELVRRDALAPSFLGRAICEWDSPSHAEHAMEGRTLWQLHNAVTEAIKPANSERAAVPGAWIRTRIMTSVFDDRLAREPGTELAQDVGMLSGAAPADPCQPLNYPPRFAYFPAPAVPGANLRE